jgi:hypothetical protein
MWGGLAIWMLTGSLCSAAEKAAVIVSPDGPPAILLREGPDKPWQFTKDKDPLYPGAEILGGLGATVESADGAVQARFLGNLAKLSPFPILESSIVFQEARDADLAFEMVRGRIDVINHKKSGPAKVKVTVRGKTGEITLMEPGARLVIEIYSRWPKGVRFTKTPKETDVPAMALAFIAAKGEVQLKGKDHVFTIKAPPGPALLMVSSFGDEAPQLQTLDKVPDWVDEKDSELHKKVRALVKHIQEQAAKTSLGEALLQVALAEDEKGREMALILLAGLDDLEQLAAAMTKSKHPDVLDNGIVVMRHWIGRGPGQDLKLYNAFIEKAKWKPAEAEMAMQLLHSFSDAEVQKPETYETLISCLECERPLIRGLANWHLIRLVRAGKQIGFMATAPAEDREKAVKAWRELVPEGTIPGQPKQKK